MGRYFIKLSYLGKNYHGWQSQQNAHSVQDELNDRLQQLFGIGIPTIASGRTDTGVHAEQQFVQIDLDFELTANHLFRLNRILPVDIAVHGFYKVREEAHARFDAASRTYEYRISRTKNPFLNGLAYHFSKSMDLSEMNAACKLLMQHEDFQSFSKIHTDVDHFRCTLFQASWEEKQGLAVFTVEANRFLRGMVRALVGTMLEVGLGRVSLSQLDDIIARKDRRAAGRSVPAHGLYLTKIKYPKDIFI